MKRLWTPILGLSCLLTSCEKQTNLETQISEASATQPTQKNHN